MTERRVDNPANSVRISRSRILLISLSGNVLQDILKNQQEARIQQPKNPSQNFGRLFAIPARPNFLEEGKGKDPYQ